MFNSASTHARAPVFISKTAVQRSSLAATALLAASTVQPAVALTINPVFDSSIASRANASTIQTAFNTVAQDFARQFTSNAQINVQVSWGSVGGQKLPGNAVGAST